LTAGAAGAITKANTGVQDAETDATDAARKAEDTIKTLKTTSATEISTQEASLKKLATEKAGQLEEDTKAQFTKLTGEAKAAEVDSAKWAATYDEDMKQDVGGLNPDGADQANAQLASTVSRTAQKQDADAKEIADTIAGINDATKSSTAYLTDEIKTYKSKLDSALTSASAAAGKVVQETSEQSKKAVQVAVKKSTTSMDAAQNNANKAADEFKTTTDEMAETGADEIAGVEGARVEADDDTADLQKITSDGLREVDEDVKKKEAAMASTLSKIGNELGGTAAKFENKADSSAATIEAQEAQLVKNAQAAGSKYTADAKKVEEEGADNAQKNERTYKGMDKEQQNFAAGSTEVDKKTEEVTAEADEAQEAETRKVNAFAKAFVKQLVDTKSSRTGMEQQVQAETAQMMGTVDSGMHTFKRMEDHVVGKAKWAVSNAGADERKMDRSLNDLLVLEHYQDASALKEVTDSAANLTKKINSLKDWGAKTTTGVGEWRENVKQLFSDFDAEFEVEELELSEQEAAEQWAIQRQMADLGNALEGDLGQMDQQTQLMVAKLAQESAREIAALMADTKLSAEEKANRLAAIKEKTRQQAMDLVDNAGRLNLNVVTGQRKLHMSIEEIEQAVDRIAKLDENDLQFHEGTSITDVMDAIKNMVSQADAMLSAPSADKAEAAAKEVAADSSEEEVADTKDTKDSDKEEVAADSSFLQSDTMLRELRKARMEDDEALANLRKNRA